MDLYWIWRFFFWAERTGGKKRELVLVGRRWSWIESGRSRQWPVEAGAHGGGAERAKQVGRDCGQWAEGRRRARFWNFQG